MPPLLPLSNGLCGRLAAVWLAALAPLAAQATCPKHCVTLSSVVHAAGVPEAKVQAEAIEFEGVQLSGSAAPAVKQLAQALKTQPSKAAVQLRVLADDGLTGSAARQQAKARAKALTQALRHAGAPAKSFKVSSGT